MNNKYWTAVAQDDELTHMFFNPSNREGLEEPTSVALTKRYIYADSFCISAIVTNGEPTISPLRLQQQNPGHDERAITCMARLVELCQA